MSAATPVHLSFLGHDPPRFWKRSNARALPICALVCPGQACQAVDVWATSARRCASRQPRLELTSCRRCSLSRPVSNSTRTHLSFLGANHLLGPPRSETISGTLDAFRIPRVQHVRDVIDHAQPPQAASDMLHYDDAALSGKGIDYYTG